MAISDIPEYIEVAPGELIRADHWNGMQRQIRNSVRTHLHTRAVGAPSNDTVPTDEAQQIGTVELADGAVTAAKLAPGAITAAAIPDNAVTTTKLADGAVTSAKMATSSITTTLVQNGAITSAKLSFETIQRGEVTLDPGGTREEVVQPAAPSKETTIYFPTLTIVGSNGRGISNVEASIVYRQAVDANTIDVCIRLVNQGEAAAHIMWRVLTFTS